MQPIWSGYLIFGLVSIPVEVYAVLKPKTPSFHLLHRKDLQRIYYEKICPEHGEVNWKSVVRGYEFQKGKYVTLEESEFEKIDPDLTRTITVTSFVNFDEISLLQYQSSYWLIPKTAGKKAYFLLADVLSEEKKVALAKVVLKTRAYMAIIRSEQGALVMSTMVFANEIRHPSELGLPKKVESSAAERKMAKQIVAAMSEKYNAAKYRDEYCEKLMSIIKAKIAGRKIVLPKAKKIEVKNIVLALKKSMKQLEKAQKGKR
jgi:DNA end-binding protein Ku